MTKTKTAARSSTRKKPVNGTWKHALQSHKWLYILIIPGVAYMIVFNFLPMLGLVMAFQDFSPYNGDSAIDALIHSPFVGLDVFKKFFTGPDFWRLLKNTLSISIASLIFYFPMPIILALLLNEVGNQKYKKLVQTVSYLPHFISTVVVVGMLSTMFSSTGIVNQALNALGIESKPFMVAAGYFRPMYIGSNVWQTVGWGSIIYLAALSGLDMELYEAARIDGAGRWQQTLHITLPGIMPTIIIMLILDMGKIMNVSYQKILLMMTGSNQSVSDVISTYVYRRGIIGGDFEYATGVDLFRSVVSLLFVAGTNAISRRVTETSLW